MARNRQRLALLAALAVVVASPALAAPNVEVRFGPAVQTRMSELGSGELKQQADYLRQDVLKALARTANPPKAVTLVIEDIEPTLPTSAQLGSSPQLRADSVGLGGSAVTGELVTADGRRLPIRYRYFPQSLVNEVNFTTWGDADEGFDTLAGSLSRGMVPNDPHPWPAPHRARAVTGTRIPG